MTDAMRRTASISLVPVPAHRLGIVALSAPAALAAELPGGGYLRTSYSIDGYYESVWGNRLNSTLDVGSDGDAWHYDENLRITFSRPLSSGLGVEFAFWGRHTSDALLQRNPGEEWMANEVRLRLTGETFDIGLGNLRPFLQLHLQQRLLWGLDHPAPLEHADPLRAGRRQPLAEDRYLRPCLRRPPHRSRPHTRPLALGELRPHRDHRPLPRRYRDRLRQRRLVGGRPPRADGRTTDRRGRNRGQPLRCRPPVGRQRPMGSAPGLPSRLPPSETSFRYWPRGSAWTRRSWARWAPSADRETMSIGARYTPSDAFTATAYFRYYEGLVTDIYGAEYHAVTRDPAVTIAWRPFMYDPGSRFTNLALDCTVSYTSERSTDPGNTVSFERIYAHLGLTDTRGPWRFGAAYDLEQDDDMTATDLDTLANTVTLSLGWRYEADGYTLSTDLMAQVKLKSIQDNVAGRRYLDVSPRVVAGISAVINPGSDYPTRWSLRYDEDILSAQVRREPCRARVRGPVRAGLPGGRRDNRHPRDGRPAPFRGLARTRTVLRGGGLRRLRAPGVLDRR